MTRAKSASLFIVAAAASILLIGGCAGTRTAPHMGFGSFNIETQFSRDDIEVLERVEGTSTTDSILLGVIQVIDGRNWKLLGICFFNDRYTCVNLDPCPASTEGRAYYKALEAAPEADAVFYKTMNRESRGVPIFWNRETVTFSGKAIALKAD